MARSKSAKMPVPVQVQKPGGVWAVPSVAGAKSAPVASAQPQASAQGSDLPKFEMLEEDWSDWMESSKAENFHESRLHQYTLRCVPPPPAELPPPPPTSSLNSQSTQATTPKEKEEADIDSKDVLQWQSCTKEFMLSYRGVSQGVLCGSAVSNLPLELEFSTLKGVRPELAAQSPEKDVEDKSKDGRQAMDKLLHQCFFAAAVKDLNLPMKGTRLYVDYMRPNRPAGTSLDVKASSFQNLAKFLQHLEADGLLSLVPGMKDPVVTAIHFDNPAFRSIVPNTVQPSVFQCKDVSKSKPPRAVTALSLGAADLRPAWMQQRTKSITTKLQEVEDGETPRTAVTTARSASSGDECRARSASSGDESSINFGSSSSDCKETADDTVTTEIVSNTTRLASCGWTTGDFKVGEAWNLHLAWEGGESALQVQKDDMVYVGEVDEQGWAKAASSSSGEQGWLPANLLRRFAHVASNPYAGGPGYLVVNVSDSLVVYHRDGTWAYGAKIQSKEGAEGVKESFATGGEEQVIEEGWFPCAAVARD